MKKCNKRAELSGKTLTGTTVFVAIVALCMVAASMQSWAVTHGNIGADTGRIPDKGVRYRGIFINDESPRPASCAVEDGALVVRGVTAGGALKY